MSGTVTPRTVLIPDEQTKLLANAMDTASSALGAGSILPLVNIRRTTFAANPGGYPVSALAGSAVAFILIAFVLHFGVH